MVVTVLHVPHSLDSSWLIVVESGWYILGARLTARQLLH